jgi:hypothetical protein
MKGVAKIVPVDVNEKRLPRPITSLEAWIIRKLDRLTGALRVYLSMLWTENSSLLGCGSSLDMEEGRVTSRLQSCVLS